MKIDAHQHFWQFDPVRDQWISEEMKVLKRHFMPEDLEPILKNNDIDGCVSVQADQSVTETHFLLSLAEKHSFIKAVVGWIDLKAPTLEEQLVQLKAKPLLKGFRHILQAEENDFMLDQAFLKGVFALFKHNFSYDILVYHNQLGHVINFIESLPPMRLVIDHFAKPDLKQSNYQQWLTYMKSIAPFEHVYVKLSGLITEADWNNWTKDQIAPIIREIIQLFGPDRILYGSDWPVSLLAGSYEQVLELAYEGMSDLNASEKDQIMGQNAIQFYDIKVA